MTSSDTTATAREPLASAPTQAAVPILAPARASVRVWARVDFVYVPALALAPAPAAASAHMRKLSLDGGQIGRLEFDVLPLCV